MLLIDVSCCYDRSSMPTPSLTPSLALARSSIPSELLDIATSTRKKAKLPRSTEQNICARCCAPSLQLEVLCDLQQGRRSGDAVGTSSTRVARQRRWYRACSAAARGVAR
eukprot:760112-Pleurochrysis_carterae.AAC.1